jgi:2-keto-4-pentenoate hydratase
VSGVADAVVSAAARLAEAQTRRAACDPVRTILPAGDIEAGYAVQQANVRRRLAAGERLVGRKIGLTSAAVQRQLGVDQPDYGALFDRMCLPDGGQVDPAEFIAPRAEAEVALVLGRDLDHDRHTVVDLLRAVEFALPAIEIVDSRVRDWDIAIVDTVADNGSSGAFVLGSRPVRLSDVDVRAVTMELTYVDQIVSTGTGAACLGNPLHAAAWLADALVAHGTPLRAGDVVLTGALGPMVPLTREGRLAARIDGLGVVTAEVGKVAG